MAIEPIESADVATSAPALRQATRAQTALNWVSNNRVRLLKFASVGATGVVVNLLVFEFCFQWAFAGAFSGKILFGVSNTVGFLVSVFTNFLLNDLWTWGDRRKGTRRDGLKRLTKYYITASVAGVVQISISLVSLMLVWGRLPVVVFGIDLSPRLAVLTGIACGMAINFIASHLWAFRDARSE
ncbi:MAG: GtrA family protein [Bradymonadaceae bacterium]|nr:GtrA family protein [Lujinxingiaceae bacterium]